jgi:hypothetical protein
MKDARSFHEKSQIVKHWMERHSDMNQPPPFRFRVLRLSNQAVECENAGQLYFWTSYVKRQEMNENQFSIVNKFICIFIKNLCNLGLLQLIGIHAYK